MSISSLRSIVDGLPFETNTLVLETNGTISRRAPQPVRFTFRVGDQEFEGRAERNEEGGELQVVGDLGPMPFSAENREARLDLSHILSRGAGHTPGIRFALDARQHITLEGSLLIPDPMSPQQLVGAAAKLVADALPWLELLTEATARIRDKRDATRAFSAQQ